jgi:DNA topoisomerase-2
MSRNKKVEEIWKELTPEEHVLMKPGMYLGAVKKQISEVWLVENNRMVLKEVEYLPAFIKLFDEIISNSVDESKRQGSKLDTIKVHLKDNYISVWDNGGIPCVIHKEKGQYIAEMVFSSLRAGSNFDDSDERIVVGTNGLGSVLVNLFSKEFVVSSCDGKKRFYQEYSDNMSKRTTPKITNYKKNHTEIKFLTDFEKLTLEGIDDIHYQLLYKRVFDLAGINSNINFYFNDVKINIPKFDDYIKHYTESYIIDNNKHRWKLAIAHSNNGFRQISFANGAHTTDGGTHVDYILNQIIVKLRSFFEKKYKIDVKPSELKNHIMLFLDAEVINPAFNSQTKEKLITEIKDFGTEYIVSDKFIQSILKSEIINSILDWVSQKKKADESRLAREINKNISKIKVEKLIDAKSKDRWKCSIGIYEGDSAVSAFRKYRDTQTMGAFALKGKFINVSDISTKKLSENNEAINLMAAIGLKLGEDVNIKSLRYGRILFYTDADTDGNSISGLLLNFFNKYWPDLFDRGMVFKVETPIVVAISKKNKKNKKLFYSQNEYDNWLYLNDIKNWDIKYKKGLAALVDDEYNEIINNPKLTKISKDDLSDEYLDIWFGKNSELRKNQILK